MGHERIGALPRTRPWVRVVEGIVAAADFDGEVDELASLTLENVRSRLAGMYSDTGVVAAFEFLIGLSLSASGAVDRDSLGHLAVDFDSNPSPLKLANILATWVDTHRQSGEYAEIARKAAVEAIAGWSEQKSSQLTFAGQHEQAVDVWRAASDGRGFCEVARLFFASLTERYLNYFISREASSQVFNMDDRERLARRLHDHAHEISLHAFETAKITQSFAAGWFNRYARDKLPSREDTRRFLAVSMEKMQEELGREADPL